ncbi:MAG: efflux RND transporter permease subunit [Leptospirales bacterium]|nr:efflux RND transporter permease subunit [Leptospirales bacterium]
MIARIIRFSAEQRSLVLIAIAALLLAAFYAIRRVPLDALPDLSDTQVIVYSRWDRSPDLIEDQVTYPIISALASAPGVRTVRGVTDFGYSYVYVIFEDGVDLYWARSRVLEYLSKIQGALPEGVRLEMGPDASSVGWIFQYALRDQSGQRSLAELRSLQDWYLRYQLQSVEGVAEVASFGGFVKQYQVQLNPNALTAYGLSLQQVVEAVRRANVETGGRLLELSGREYMIRGRGYVRSVGDLESTAVTADPRTGAAVLLRQLGSVSIGPELRRGVADLDGEGDAPGGIVVMRHGENALAVIERVKQRLEQLQKSMPSGVEIVTTYDRSSLIRRAIKTLQSALIEEMIIVAAVILLFLWHWPSASTAIITIPVSVFLSFLPLYFLGVTSNIMSLAGIAISIGVLVDGAIVQVENMYHRVQQWMEGDRQESLSSVRLRALTEVGGSIFFSLLVIAVAFLPVFALTDQEGRLFRPLAYSKNLAMAIAAVLAITLDPAVRMLFSREHPFSFRPAWLARIASALLVGRYYPESQHPVNRRLLKVYEPLCRFALQRPRLILGIAAAMLVATIPVAWNLMRNSEAMPPLYEGTILYMPMTVPGISISEAQRSLQVQDRILRSFPEVASVHGKAGRADTSTDPAGLNMIETMVELKPESEWRKKERWYSFLPEFARFPFHWIWPEHISHNELRDEMNRAIQMPGWGNVWTMPIQNRVFMLSTGIRSPIGLKISGPDLQMLERVGLQIESALRHMPGVDSVVAERAGGGYFLDIELRREELARYGLSAADAQMAVSQAIGGENVSMAIEGRERYPINVRYAREYRDNLAALRRVLVMLPSGAQIPLNQIADLQLRSGPGMIRDEDGALTAYVSVDVSGQSVGAFIAAADDVLRQSVQLPPGYQIRWSGQYESIERMTARLRWIVPLTLALIIGLLYLNTRSAARTFIILAAVPFSLIGAFWLVFALGYNLSPAVWVGMIALLGLDAETGAFMLLFLDISLDDWRGRGALNNMDDLREATLHGAVQRLRPKLMTVASGMAGLLPIMWSTGAGADVMKRIAAPMIGGLATSFMLELFIYPVLYELWQRRKLQSVSEAVEALPIAESRTRRR